MDPYGNQTVYNTNQNLSMEEDNKNITYQEVIKAFTRFIKEFQLGHVYKYRDQLLVNLMKQEYKMVFDFEDIDSDNQHISNMLTYRPSETVPQLEKAIREVCFDLTTSYKKIDEVPEFQCLINVNSNPKTLRELNASTIEQLVVVHGIIISSTKPAMKMSMCAFQCRNCGDLKYIAVKPGFAAIKPPRVCDSNQQFMEKKEKCPVDPYIIVEEYSKFIDVQTLKIQEVPESIPTGEIPRSYLLYCDRTLVSKVTPGTRLTVVGIQLVDERSLLGETDRPAYIRVLQFQVESQKSGKQSFNFSQEDELKIHNLAKDPKIYEKVSKSIANAIYGSEDVKKAIACLLFGGCRKKLNEGVNLRGDINVLLLGDPSTAKSQFLKFVERVAPIAVYTSGKGSSAAGLTASIIRDPSSGEFQLEGGAMVLADGGIVCIDEFDKMRAQDRVAIHEAMEQQTISVAKAGITTTLNSRTSVLAAANPIYGRIDDLKTTQEQIDFQSTILSRFDCIFLVKDVRDVKKDEMLAKHIVDLNTAGKVSDKRDEGEIPINDLKKFIAYAKMKCTPKLTERAAEELKNFYVKDRKIMNENKNSKKGNAIPVTVRQLEAIIRLSEAIAKMSLSQIVTEAHVAEAHRLFTISTMSAASSRGSLTYDIPPEHAKLILRIEDAIRRRLSIGSKIAHNKLVEELHLKYNSGKMIEYALINMLKRDEITYSESRKIIQRKK